MSELKLTGTIKVIGDVQSFDSGFSKREFVITTPDQYPQDIKFDFFKDKTSILDKYKVGDNVEVGFNVLGHEYNSKYYVNLNAWRINKVEDTKAPEPVAEAKSGDSMPF